ncbi:MAG: SPFH domain-containing protein [Patescibacteria group bacterium]
MNLEVKRIRTLRTNSVGALISIGVGLLIAGVCLSAFLLFTPFSFENWWWAPTFIPGFLAAGLFFEQGHREEIKIGYVGVMTFLGQRIDNRVLSEGRPWLFPWLFDFEPVDARVKTVHVKQVVALSTDNVKMTGEAIFTHKIGDADTFLSAEDPILVITQYGTSEFRNEMSGGHSEELEKPETKNQLAARLLARMKIKGAEIGINVLDYTIPEILPPPKISDAAAELRKEEAETKSEGAEIDHVVKGMDKLMAKGMNAELAAETLQVERGKGTRVVHVHRFAGLDGIATTIGDAVVAAFAKGASRTKEGTDR